MAVFSGNDVKVWIDTVEVPNIVSSSMSVNDNLIEATTKPTGNFTEVIPGRYSANLSLDLMGLHDYIQGTSGLIRFGRVEPLSWVANYYIESVDTSAGSDEAVTTSLSIKVTGELSKFIPTFDNFDLCTNTDVTICTDTGETICVKIQNN